MGKNKKGFNWKARQVVQTEIVQDKTEPNQQVEVEISDVRNDKYDTNNPLLLPATKRKTKIVKSTSGPTKILSKKQRKKLEKIVELKKKKENRSTLLEELAKVQASQATLEKMTSITTVQTKGLKRIFHEREHASTLTEASSSSNGEKLVIGKKRKWREEDEEEENEISDPNVVGLEVEESEESENEKSASEEEEKKDEKVEEKMEEPPKSPEKVEKPEEIVKPTEEVPKKVYESRPATFVPVHRTPEIQAARLNLPILAEEQSIMEAIRENPVIILAGETGSGKTTQVPQFLYEAGYATNGRMIGVTEPRRVAATSMAQRVAAEMNLTNGEVGYQIRFEGNVKDNTQIKFMTDGVLLKEVQKDFLLKKYSVIIIDEAHERSVYSDILLGLLSRIVPLRHKKNDPLKLIIMSATLRVEDFTENPRLFKNKPPVIKVESRQFPVTVHFNKRTPFEDYVSEAFRKVCKIHRELPEGGILVFVTGQQEVNSLCRKLLNAFPSKKVEKSRPEEDREAEKDEVKEDAPLVDEIDEDLQLIQKKIRKITSKRKDREISNLPKIDLDHYSALPLDQKENDDDVDDDTLGDLVEEDDDEESEQMMRSMTSQPLWVLPLYSLLPTHKQQKVFQPPPEGYRLCVVATNVAETSLTIPNVRYVVDSGRVKTKFYDKLTGVSAFHVTWTSQAAANQRAGRAGRTGPGHCYRLYSSAVFNDEFEKFSAPDITRRPIDDLVLQMKSMDIDKVVHFPFPTAPDAAQLCAAERRLILLGALEAPPRNLRLKNAQENQFSSRITPLGRAMAAFPVAPRFAKMLLLSQQHDLLPLTILLVASLSVQELLLDHPAEGASGNLQKKWLAQRRQWAGQGQSLLLGDAMVLLRAVGAAEYAGTDEFCVANGIRPKALREIRKLRVQLTNEASAILPGASGLAVDPKMAPPTEIQAKLLRQILLAGLPDQVARRITEDELKEAEDKRNFRFAYRCPEMQDPVHLSPTCVLRGAPPEWIVYQEIHETTKLYFRGVTAIDPDWLPVFSPSQCTFSAPLETPPPRFDTSRGKVVCHMNVTFGRSGWPLTPTELDYPAGLDRFKWFARFFLEGTVCPLLLKYVKSLISPPTTMIKTWARLQPRTEILLKALVSKNVDTYDTLLQVWTQEKDFLLEAYKNWIPEALHGEVEAKWPPL